MKVTLEGEMIVHVTLGQGDVERLLADHPATPDRRIPGTGEMVTVDRLHRDILEPIAHGSKGHIDLVIPASYRERELDKLDETYYDIRYQNGVKGERVLRLTVESKNKRIPS